MTARSALDRRRRSAVETLADQLLIAYLDARAIYELLFGARVRADQDVIARLDGERRERRERADAMAPACIVLQTESP